MSATRRSVLRTAAWSVPAIHLSTATPAFARSPGGTGACLPFSVNFAAGATTGAPAAAIITIDLQATSPSTSQVYTVRLTSTKSASTETSIYNLSQTGSGINGGFSADGRDDHVVSGFGPKGAVVLNQKALDNPASPLEPLTTPQEWQDIAFQVFDPNGNLVSTVNDMSITVFDTTSVTTATPWRPRYWDTIGFSATPSSIVPDAVIYPGNFTGAGTTASPFRRAGGHEPTRTDLGEIRDTFTFNTFASGTTMRYAQHNNRHGWHFVALSGLTFNLNVCS